MWRGAVRRDGVPPQECTSTTPDAMLTQTTEIAIRALLHLAIVESEDPIALPHLAAKIDVSPSYLVKVVGHLIRVGIVRSVRGVQGGVLLARDPSAISLLEVVEACQGRILGDYCEGRAQREEVCAFHHAMLEVYEAMISVLSRWHLSDLVRRPEGVVDGSVLTTCKMKLVSLGLPTRQYQT
jgi:Rrf2 family protein